MSLDLTSTLNSGNNGAVQTPTLGPEFKVIYERQMLKNARNVWRHQAYGRKRTLKNGNKLEVRRATPLAPIATALVEGVVPNPLTFEVTKQEMDAKTWGAYIRGTDLVEAFSFDPLLSVIAEELGAQAGESIDIACRDILVGGTNVQYANGKLARNALLVTDILTAKELLKARTTMIKNLAPRRSGQYYDLLTHPSVAADLLIDPIIAAAMNAGDHKSELYVGSLGTFMGISIEETALGKVFPAAGGGAPPANIYCSILFGQNAYAVVDIAGIGMQMIFKGKGSAGTADPLEMFWTSGWKTSFGAAIERQLYMLRIESGATNG